MNKGIKNFIKATLIFTVTLAVGFGITAISFNLFESLSRNQMRLLFAFDVITLLAIGSIVWLYFENKAVKKKKEQELKERHNRRIEAREREMRDIEIITAKNKFAA